MKERGTPTLGRFSQRVRNRLKIKELSLSEEQKSVQEYKRKGDRSKLVARLKSLHLKSQANALTPGSFRKSGF